MEILCFCFLQLIREQMEIKAISYQMRPFFGISRTNGNLTQNACTKNEKGISFVRERTVYREKFGWIAINIRKSTIQIHRP